MREVKDAEDGWGECNSPLRAMGARIPGHEKILAAPGRIDPPARIIHPGSNPGFIIYRV